MIRTTGAIYSVRGLTRVYPHPIEPIVALAGVDIEIGPGMTAIVGPSGQGKTTLLNMLGAMDRPTSGVVVFQGEPLRFNDECALRRHRATRVAWVFQELNLIGHLTARENVALPRLFRRMPRARALALADRSLGVLGVARLAGRLPGQLSRGQQQRVAIARAFASGAEVILADEPTGSLDPERSEEVMAAFRQAADASGTPVVLVTHDHALAHRYAHRVLECAAGLLHDVTTHASASPTGTTPTTHGDGTPEPEMDGDEYVEVEVEPCIESGTTADPDFEASPGRVRSHRLPRKAARPVRIGLSLAEAVRFALSDLLYRRPVWLLTLLALVTPLTFALWLGYYAASLWRYKAAELERTVPTRITAICPDPADLGRRWSEANLGQVAGWQGVVAAYQRIEQTVKLSARPDTPVTVTVEGLRPDDPSWRDDLFEWGRFFSEGPNQDEVVLGTALFARLGGVLTNRGPEPAFVTATLSRTVDGRPEVETVRLRVAGLLRYQSSDRVFVPLPLAERLDLWCLSKVTDLSAGARPATPAAQRAWTLVATGPEGAASADSTAGIEAEADALHIRLDRGVPFALIRAERPIRAEVEATDRAPDAATAGAVASLAGVTTRPVRRLDVELAGFPVVVDAWPDDDPRWAQLTGRGAPGFATLVAADAAAFRSELLVGGQRLQVIRAHGEVPKHGAAQYYTTLRTLHWIGFRDNITGLPGPRLPQSWALRVRIESVARAIARRVQFAVAEARRTLAPAGRPVSDLLFDDPLAYASARSRCAAAGLTWTPRSVVSESPVSLHEFHDASRDDGLVSERLQVVVGVSRPVFLAAGPLHLESVRFDGDPAELPLNGSHADDPRRFGSLLHAGRWLGLTALDEIVVSPALAKRLTASSGADPGALIGRVVAARFARGGDATGDTTMDLPLTVVGVAQFGGDEAESAVTRSELLEQVASWRRRELVYDRTRERFESPRRVYQRNGHLRATVIVNETDDVAPVVTRLERSGYLTQNSLGQQAGLRRLTWALWGLVLLLVLGGAITAGINVGSTTALNIQTKLWEIAVLHALGASRWNVLAVFGVQALVLAVGSFALAGAVVILGEPALRPVLHDTLGLPTEAIVTEPITAAAFGWLYALAGATALVLCLGGMLVPAWLAVGPAPDRALRARG